MRPPDSTRLSVLFVSHAPPMVALASLAVPTSEHFDPLLVVLGAATDGRMQDVYRGLRYGTLIMRSLALSTPDPMR